MRKDDTEQRRNQIIEVLQKWLPDFPVDYVSSALHHSIPFDDLKDASLGILLRVGPQLFNIHWKSTSSTAAILHSIHFLKQDSTNKIPVIAVPFMGPTGQRLCEQQQVNWMDLSGNAFIQAPGILINSTGKPNKFLARGRKASIFSPKSSNVIRWVLLNPRRTFTNNQLVHEAGLDAGHVSRILAVALKSGYISRSSAREYRLVDGISLLRDWRNSYDFFQSNSVVRGHIPVRSSDELVERLYNWIAEGNVSQWALTGLASAWRYTLWATYRLITLYVDKHPGEQRLSELTTFREESKGANLWIAIPKSDGVFLGAEVVQGTPCVSRLQTYLDLKEQPERSEEAAQHLYETLILK